jgi:hypothetical protein
MSATRSPLTLPCSNFVPASHNPDSAHPLSNDTADEERLARWKLMARVTLEPSKGQRSDGTAAPPSTPLLTGAGLSISASERLCLVGRNGSGKSTLLKIAVGQVEPDCPQPLRPALGDDPLFAASSRRRAHPFHGKRRTAKPGRFTASRRGSRMPVGQMTKPVPLLPRALRTIFSRCAPRARTGDRCERRTGRRSMKLAWLCRPPLRARTPFFTNSSLDAPEHLRSRW